MRERVELLAGELVIDSSPGRGATVRAILPSYRVERADMKPHLAGEDERAHADGK
jgi:signal transduction histidine kinase